MRVLGCGMTQFATRWSSGADSNIGTVAHLRELLEEIVVEEISLKRLKRLPTEAAQPQFLARERTQLGTPDADVLEVETRVARALKRRRGGAKGGAGSRAASGRRHLR